MSQVLIMLMNAVLGMLTPELLKKFADMLLDFCENFVLGSASPVDDKIVLPLCAAIRAAFDIPDND